MSYIRYCGFKAMQYQRTCEACGAEFVALNIRKRFCNALCSGRAYAPNNQTYTAPLGLSTGTSGALSGLRVCVDLMARGFHVFRALSPSCPCDLVVHKDDKVLRIEVKTTRRSLDGRVILPKSDPSKYDVLALVLDAEIVYDPPV